MTLFPDGSVDFNFGKGKNWENHGKGLITFIRSDDKITAEVSDCGMKLNICYPLTYNKVDLVSSYYQCPVLAYKEYEFNEDTKILCQKTIKNGGGTKREFPENLLKPGEEDWNKWCAINCKKQSSWTLIEFKESLIISALGFKSANDAPYRDPTSVEVYIYTVKE